MLTNAISALFDHRAVEGSFTSGSHEVFLSCFQSLMGEIRIVMHCESFCSDGLPQTSLH